MGSDGPAAAHCDFQSLTLGERLGATEAGRVRPSVDERTRATDWSADAGEVRVLAVAAGSSEAVLLAHVGPVGHDAVVPGITATLL